MTYYTWLVIASLAISVVEYLYRSNTYTTFADVFPLAIIPIMVGQVCLYYGFKQAPSLFVAGALFSLITILLRIGNTYWTGGSINAYNWLGVVLLFISLMLLKMK